jgi:ribosome biogenesis GTPase
MTLKALGWCERHRSEFMAHAAAGLVPGRIIAEHRNYYRVATGSIELAAGTTGFLRNSAVQRSDLPGVGDFVGVRLAAGNGPSTIEIVLARNNRPNSQGVWRTSATALGGECRYRLHRNRQGRRS